MVKCNGNTDCIQNNVNACGTFCNTKSSCTGFAYNGTNDICIPYANTNGDWNLNANFEGITLYLKDSVSTYNIFTHPIQHPMQTHLARFLN